MSYLQDLLDNLAEGAKGCPEAREAARFLRSTQRSDGSWAGRSDQSDLYWTSFALRTAYVVSLDDEHLWTAAVAHLQARATSVDLSLIDLISVVLSLVIARRAGYAAMPIETWQQVVERLCERLEASRTPDGGYADRPGSQRGSTYQTFLAWLTYGELQRPMPAAETAIRFLLSRQRPDGGFSETGLGRGSGTNPTAAAVAVLSRCEDWPAAQRQRTIQFLLSARGPDGGFRANSRIPFSDLLSTFTATVALHDLGHRLSGSDWTDLQHFARQLQTTSGGFRGAGWDTEPDPEYTFYGVGLLALANRAAQSQRQPSQPVDHS